MSELPAEFRPRPLMLRLGPALDLFLRGREELAQKAVTEPSRCYCFIPSLDGQPGIDNELPDCIAFQEVMPPVDEHDRSYSLGMMRVCLTEPPQRHGFHLNGHPDKVIAEKVKIDEVLACRSMSRLYNGGDRARTTTWLDVDPASDEVRPYLKSGNGLITLREPQKFYKRLRHITLPARQGDTLFGAELAVTRVLHIEQTLNLPDVILRFCGQEQGA